MIKISEERKEQLKTIVRTSIDHVEGEDKVGCYYCGNIYSPSEIKQFALNGEGEHKCPVCPYCGIDSVIGEESSGIKLTTEILEEIHSTMF